jgi:hypothetical protein
MSWPTASARELWQKGRREWVGQERFFSTVAIKEEKPHVQVIT